MLGRVMGSTAGVDCFVAFMKMCIMNNCGTAGMAFNQMESGQNIFASP